MWLSNRSTPPLPVPLGWHRKAAFALIARLIEPHLTNLPAEKMVDIVITVLPVNFKVLFYHGAVGLGGKMFVCVIPAFAG